MTREEIATASDLLESAAADAAGEAGERLAGLADQLGNLATSDPGPDHGRLARIQSALDEVQSDVDDDTAAAIQRAYEEIHAYRETLEGV